MAKRKRINKLMPKVEKFALGDFVTGNAENSANYQAQIDAIPEIKSVKGSAALSGLGAGATIGSVGGPIGTAVGAVVGGIGGLIFGGAADQRAERQRIKAIGDLNEARSNITQDLYNSSISTTNNNPYGIYEMGGDILDPIINIERGELQIDPESGKVLREYTGYNPETGGLYEPHSSRGKDSVNNMVTAKEDTFIITKAKAKDYKKSIENNDQLQRNAILQNIRNEKRRRKSLVPEKFAIGGDIIPLATSGVTPNLNFNIPTNLNPKANLNIGTSNFSNTGTPINYGNVANDILGFGSGLYNIVQGSRSPNYQNYRPVRLDIENRREILDNMPREVSANPALNNIRRSRRQAYNTINQGTSNPTIARANALALENTFLDAENNALYNNEILNNQIRGQRSSILSNLSNQDMNRTAMNVNNMNQVDEINRALSLAKEQQVNTGVSQIIENQRNRQFISDQKRNDRFRLQLLRDMSPYIGNYMDNWEQYLDR